MSGQITANVTTAGALHACHAPAVLQSSMQNTSSPSAKFTHKSSGTPPLRHTIAWGLFLAAVCALAGWGIWHYPLLRAERLSHLSVKQLELRTAKDKNDPQVLYALGVKLNRMQDYTHADPVLRRAVGLDPDNAAYRNAWANALMGSGLVTAAYGELKQYSGTHPDDAVAHAMLGRFYLTQGSSERARDEYLSAVRLNSNRAEYWSGLGSAYASLHEFSRSNKALNRALALKPSDGPDHLLLAQNLSISSQNSAAAEREYQTALHLMPRSIQALLLYSRYLITVSATPGSIQMALGMVQKVLAENPQNPEGCLLEAKAELMLGRKFDAAAVLQKAAALNPYSVYSAKELAAIYTLQKNARLASYWQKAAQTRQQENLAYNTLNSDLQQDPKNRRLLLQMARTLGIRGDAQGALRTYALALGAAQDSAPVLIAASVALTDGGHASTALSMAQRALALAQDNPDAHEAMGDVLLAMNLPFSAEKEFNKTIQWEPQRKSDIAKRITAWQQNRTIHPTQAMQQYQLAMQLTAKRCGIGPMPTQAVRLLNDALVAEPENAKILASLLQTAIAEEHYHSAEKLGRQLTKMFPADANAALLYGIALTETASTADDYKLAATEIRLAARHKGLQASWNYAVGELALKVQDYKDAAAHLEESLTLAPSHIRVWQSLALAAKGLGNHALQVNAEQNASALLRQQQAVRSAMDTLLANPGSMKSYTVLCKLLTQTGRVMQLSELHRQYKIALQHTSKGV